MLPYISVLVLIYVIQFSDGVLKIGMIVSKVNENKYKETIEGGYKSAVNSNISANLGDCKLVVNEV